MFILTTKGSAHTIEFATRKQANAAARYWARKTGRTFKIVTKGIEHIGDADLDSQGRPLTNSYLLNH